MNLLISGASGFVSNSILSNIKKTSFVKKIGLVSTKKNIIFPKKFDSDLETYDLNDFFSKRFQISYDIYIHGMSEPRDSEYRYSLNFTNLKKSLEVCLKNNIKTFVYLSSGAVYMKKQSSFLETDSKVFLDYDGDITYGYSKVKEECEVKRFCIKNKINFIILRLFSFAGSHMINRNEFAIIDFFKSAIKHGSILVKNPDVVRSYMHENDLGHAIVNIITNEKAINKFINIGSPNAISMKELGLKISVITKAKLILEDSNFNDYYVPNINQQKIFYKQKLKDINFIIQDLYSIFNEN